MKKIKLCQIIHSLNIGGAELLLFTICRELQEQFPDFYEFVIIASNESGPLKKEFEKIGIKVISLDLAGRRFLPSVWCIWKVLIREKPDIVHTHLLPPDKYGQVAAFLAFVKNRISTVHNMEPTITLSEKKAIDIVRKYARKQIAVSISVKDNLVQRYGYNAGNIEVIYTAPSNGGLARKPKQLRAPVKIINLANLKEAKGQLFLVPAALAMKKISDNFSIEIYGDSENEYGKEVVAQISKNKLEDVIIVRGKSSSPSLLWPQFDIMISLSLWEGFPLAIIEAMSAGIPLILSDIGPHRELLEGIEGVSFVHHDSPKEIADNFKRLISDKGYYSYLSIKMIERAKDFTVKKMIEKYDGLYRSFIA